MSGNKYLLDTNTILYVLNGNKSLSDFLYQEILFISFISEIELLSYKRITTTEEKTIKNFIKEFSKIGIDHAIKEACIEIRRTYGLKVPDSIIAASALCLDIPLVTADKQFRKIKELEIINYEV